MSGVHRDFLPLLHYPCNSIRTSSADEMGREGRYKLLGPSRPEGVRGPAVLHMFSSLCVVSFVGDSTN